MVGYLEERYSLTQHLAMIAGGGRWREVRLAMFSAYFDAAGDSRQSAVVVAGFVSSATQWVEWENEWIPRLKRDNLDCFHGKELARWDSRKRAALINDLSEIICPNVAYKTAIAVVCSQVESVFSEDERKRWGVNPYSIAGRTVATVMRRWCVTGSKVMPELVFERGDQGRDGLTAWLVREGYAEPIFRPKKRYTDRKSGIVHEPAIPLQAADLLAYAAAQRLKVYLRDGHINLEFERLPRILDNIPGEAGTVEYDRLRLIRQQLSEDDPDLLIPGVKINTE